MEISFSECDDDEKCIKMLGTPSSSEVSDKYSDLVNLLQIVKDENLDVEFDGELNLLIKPSDLKFGNWKRSFGYLFSL